jgi:WD repeat-containing protein 48
MTVYRGTVSTAHLDIHGLEEAMAMWLLECLLLNKFPPAPLVKISFVMLPWPTKDPEMQLPELLNT